MGGSRICTKSRHTRDMPTRQPRVRGARREGMPRGRNFYMSPILVGLTLPSCQIMLSEVESAGSCGVKIRFPSFQPLPPEHICSSNPPFPDPTMKSLLSSLCTLAIAGSLATGRGTGLARLARAQPRRKVARYGPAQAVGRGRAEAPWKIDGIGKGYSSPAIADGKIFITGDEKGKLLIFGLDAAGKQLWKRVFGNAPATATAASPVIDGGNLSLLNGNGPIGCFDVETGDREMDPRGQGVRRLAGRMGLHGIGADQQEYGYLQARRQEFLVALDKTNGQPIWKSSGFDAGPEFGSCILCHVRRPADHRDRDQPGPIRRRCD